MTRILDGAGNLFKVVMKCLKEQNLQISVILIVIVLFQNNFSLNSK